MSRTLYARLESRCFILRVHIYMMKFIRHSGRLYTINTFK